MFRTASIRTLTTRILPEVARPKARAPLESAAIRDRVNGDSRPTWRAYMLQFGSQSLNRNRL